MSLTLGRIAELREEWMYDDSHAGERFAVLDAAEAHLKQTSAPARPEGLQDALGIALAHENCEEFAHCVRHGCVDEIIRELRALAEKAGVK